MPVLQSNQTPVSPEQHAVTTHGLTKRYKDTVAVDDLDLNVPAQQLFGVVGPDGAGKSTLLQMLAGVLKPTSGSATVFGEQIKTGRRKCGYVTQEFALPEDLSVEENLSYAAGLRGVSNDQYQQESDQLLKMTGLSKFKTRPAGKLSGGMKEKLAIACALVASPKVLFLDEPMTGVDPVSCRELQNLFVQLSLQGTAIVIATSSFEEVEICDQVAFIHGGKIHKIGSPNDLRKNSQLARIKLQLSDTNAAIKILHEQPFASQIADMYTTRIGIEVILPSNADSQLREQIASSLKSAGIDVTKEEMAEPTLENIFAITINNDLGNNEGSDSKSGSNSGSGSGSASGSGSGSGSDSPSGSSSSPDSDSGAGAGSGSTADSSFGAESGSGTDASNSRSGSSSTAGPQTGGQTSAPSSASAVPSSDDQSSAKTVPPKTPQSAATKSKGREKAIRSENVVKRYGSFTAVDDVSLEVKGGEIFGLCGANGAGKTTMIQMMCGLQKPTQGKIEVLGKNPLTAAKTVHARMGYMNQKFSLYDGLTVEENIRFYAWSYGAGQNVRQKTVSEAIDRLKLTSVRKRLVGELPRGWKQRVAFAAATTHKPDILFLDEPTSGTDPLTRRQIWSLTDAIANNGGAVVVTTHYLDEAEFCHRLAFMAAGKIITQGSPEEIMKHCPASVISIPTQSRKETVQVLAEHFGLWQLTVHPDHVRLLSEKPEPDSKLVEKVLKEKSIEFDALQTIPCTIEDAFVLAVIKNRGADD